MPRPDQVRPVWQVLAEIADALGDETAIGSAGDALDAITAEVPFYAGITADEIGGTGVRWQTREAAAAFPREGALHHLEHDAPAHDNGEEDLRLGTYRDLWAGEVTERNPALEFLIPGQRVEIAPADAERLGLTNGDQVDVRSNGTSVAATVALRDRIRPGAAFLIEGTKTDNANVFNGAKTVRIEKR